MSRRAAAASRRAAAIRCRLRARNVGRLVLRAAETPAADGPRVAPDATDPDRRPPAAREDRSEP